MKYGIVVVDYVTQEAGLDPGRMSGLTEEPTPSLDYCQQVGMRKLYTALIYSCPLMIR